MNSKLTFDKVMMNVICLIAAALLPSRGVFPYHIDLLLITMAVLVMLRKKTFSISNSMLEIIISFGVFCISIIISAIYNNATSVIYFYPIFFFILVIFFNSNKFNILLFVRYWTFINALTCMLGMLTILELLNYNELFYAKVGNVRLAGLMGNPNYFGYMIFINILLISYYNQFFKNWLYMILHIILLCGVLLSFSRTSIAAILIFYLLFFLPRIGMLKGGAGVILFIFIGVSLFKSELFIDMLNYRLENLISGDGSGRYDIWRLGFDYATDSVARFFIGVGGNGFYLIGDKIGVTNTVHNSFLRLFFELGLMGVISFFVFIALIVKSAIKGDSYYFFCSITAIMINWIGNDFFLVKETWLFLAIMFVVKNKCNLPGINLSQK